MPVLNPEYASIPKLEIAVWHNTDSGLEGKVDFKVLQNPAQVQTKKIAQF